MKKTVPMKNERNEMVKNGIKSSKVEHVFLNHITFKMHDNFNENWMSFVNDKYIEWTQLFWFVSLFNGIWRIQQQDTFNCQKFKWNFNEIRYFDERKTIERSKKWFLRSETNFPVVFSNFPESKK